MSDRYAVSGAISTILDGTVEVTGGSGVPGDGTALMSGINLLGRNNETGKALWLRSIWALNASGAVNINLLDATEAHVTDATGYRNWQRASIPCASGTATNMGTLTTVDFPAPGLKFSTGCVVVKDATNASGCFSPGTVGGSGYYA